MKKSVRRRSLLALLAAVGCLFSLGNPAAATTTTTTALIDSGTLEVSINSNPDYEISIDLSGSEMHTCTPTNPTPVSHIGYHYNHTTGMVDITTLTLGHSVGVDGYDAGYFDFGGNEYQLRTRPSEIITGSTGEVSGTHPNQTLVQHIEIEGEIAQVTTAGPPCMVGETICHFVIDLTLTGPFNWTTMTATLNGSGTPFIDFCDAPFAGLADGNVTVTDLELTG